MYRSASSRSRQVDGGEGEAALRGRRGMPCGMNGVVTRAS